MTHLLPKNAIFSPSVARIAASTARDWNYVDSWLAAKYRSAFPGRDPPEFERTPETLKALHALASFDEAAGEDRDAIAAAEASSLEEVNAARDAPDKQLRDALLEAVEDSLTAEGAAALDVMSALAVSTGTALPSPIDLGHVIADLQGQSCEIQQMASRVDVLLNYIRTEALPGHAKISILNAESRQRLRDYLRYKTKLLQLQPQICYGLRELPQYLRKLIPPVLACFTDPEARVRYYACESMYNIAKVAKGEILYFFNHLFDCLCKLCTDHELSVKNGAELLDRLIKDIVSENAVEYQSVVPKEKSADDDQGGPDEYELAFSLPKFIPLLKERILVTNPYARQFLVGWIELLDGIPDLELVSYLPDFLTGLLRFLSDENRDVHIATRKCLDRFLSEIKRIARIRKGIAESKKSNEGGKRKRVESVDSDSGQVDLEDGDHNDSDGYDDDEGNLDELQESEEEWQPGQDVEIDYSRILDILTSTLENDTSLGKLSQSWC
ncbi:Vacuole morphology and inheritance protein 14 [Ceratocystis platani]|uniref:Vacuole morphology and inheritance protein 14 n=1 Tax=Ceratocystis fimbriata f. sp. platani TaxID=88771 RepID=A0A0F8B6F2_CERFI|nr:Vacuole morphology and inheritance protein 14 [Ceratocystis platani]